MPFLVSYKVPYLISTQTIVALLFQLLAYTIV